MSAVYVLLWLAGAYGVANLIDWWREQGRLDAVIAEHLDATTQLSADYDPTDEEQGGLPAAWAQSRRDEQARTRRNDMNGAGQ